MHWIAATPVTLAQTQLGAMLRRQGLVDTGRRQRPDTRSLGNLGSLSSQLGTFGVGTPAQDSQAPGTAGSLGTVARALYHKLVDSLST